MDTAIFVGKVALGVIVGMFVWTYVVAGTVSKWMA